MGEVILAAFLKFVGDVFKQAGPGLSADTASVLNVSFHALADVIKRGVVPMTMVDWSFKAAAGILSDNLNSTPEWLVAEVVEVTRLLEQRTDITWGDHEKLGVNALAVVSLHQAGYTGPLFDLVDVLQAAAPPA